MITGKLYIISAPSGAGKTSLIKKLIPALDNIMVSVSHTTRKQRPGETEAIDYFFMPETEFKAMMQQQAFLEFAQVFDNFYGTAQSTVENSLNQGNDVILEIDWQGAEQIRRLLPEAISIFILPPSTNILNQRLQERGQDSKETIARRMQDAKTEMSHFAEYDYLIINDDFNTALTELKSIIVATRLNIDQQQHRLSALLSDLLA